MEIYVLRHGEAEPRNENVSESDRKLTRKGKRDTERVVELARAFKVHPDVVLSSPYVRALTTARIAVKCFKPKPALRVTQVLLPEYAPKEVWKEIRAHSEAQQILLVGHEPQLSSVLAYLLGCPALAVDFKKSALAAIEMDGIESVPRGDLKWLITPAFARRARVL